MGAVDGGRAYAKQSQILEILEQYNERMRLVAEEMNVEFLDLPSMVTEKEGMFYDGVHFSEKGARITAQVIGQHLFEHVLPGTR